MSTIKYSNLNARQKENYNFAKVSSRLADYGYSCIRLTDDWDGADFIAVHIDGSIRKVQLKSRLTFRKKYKKTNLSIAFRDGDDVYLFPHDKVLYKFIKAGAMNIEKDSWRVDGRWEWRTIPQKYLHHLARYKLLRPQ